MRACVTIPELHCILLHCKYEVCRLGGRPAYKTYVIRWQCIRSRTDKLLDEVHSSPPKHQAAYQLRGPDFLILAGDVLHQYSLYQSIIQ